LLNKVHHFLLLNKFFLPWLQVFVAAAAQASLRLKSKINHFLQEGDIGPANSGGTSQSFTTPQKYFCKGLA